MLGDMLEVPIPKLIVTLRSPFGFSRMSGVAQYEEFGVYLCRRCCRATGICTPDLI
jgi:hypothetical protein